MDRAAIHRCFVLLCSPNRADSAPDAIQRVYCALFHCRDICWKIFYLTVCRKLLGDLTSIVSNRKASGRDVATAVRGIGELAAPTSKFYGQEVFPRRHLLSVGKALQAHWTLQYQHRVTPLLWWPCTLDMCDCMYAQGLRNMVARLMPLAQQRALLQQVSDLQANKLGNEVCRLQQSRPWTCCQGYTGKLCVSTWLCCHAGRAVTGTGQPRGISGRCRCKLPAALLPGSTRV